ncbi:MAG: AmmeMemoRadiSam system protein A [Candidatus Izimaplasma sp.]|nr:AmmeMemoRadiSam system protein A [Candidatus Izimaplasma bacterium]
MSILAGYVVPHPPIIVDEVGQEKRLEAQQTIDAYHQVAQDIAKLKPDTIIISTPHSTLYRDYFHVSPGLNATGNLSQFGAGDVSFDVDYNSDLIKAISDQAHHNNLEIGTLGSRQSQLDHGSMVPLYFINQYYKDYNIVRISPSGFDLLKHYEIGKFIQALIPSSQNVVWVASGDLSHKLKETGPYGFAKEGPQLDQAITKALKSGQFERLFDISPTLRDKGGECGLSSFVMMSGFLDGYQLKHDFLSYEGPFGVGYAVAMYHTKQKDSSIQYDERYEKKNRSEMNTKKETEDPYINLARQSLEYFTKHHKQLPRPDNLPKAMINTKSSVFVTLFKHSQLRGCVGKTRPTLECVADEIIDSAISAGHHDYRFPKIKEKELPYLEYKVDVLYPPEPITSIEDLDVEQYGLIVRQGHKSGLLLPNLEGIDTVEEQVRIAKQKAGIKDNQKVDLERFKVIRHEVKDK